ncbi:MAG: Fic family protein [Bacteroidia bacterium]|nr:Fic family protein [Bacteroidia bacterium]
MKKVGYTWLREKLGIWGYGLTHESYIGATNKTEIGSTDAIIQTFKSKYDVPGENPLGHLEFALKYDDLNLAFIKAVFDAVGHQAVQEYVSANPNGKYSRIIGYLYEFTTGESLEANVTTSNYQDLLDPLRYITGDVAKIPRWKIRDNLLGNTNFCPIIRRTTELVGSLDWEIEAALENLQEEYSPEIFKRAAYYLFKKESKSSSEIERENPSQDRLDRFISLLESAGQSSLEESLSEHELIRLQNTIVDPRYADKEFRNYQNYIGQTLRDYSQKIHYVCPPPEMVRPLMQGLAGLSRKNQATGAVIKAAIVSFGFVFIHPFEDGNGRIHRFLIHDILVRDGIVPNGTILPVSAQILANMDKYDKCLEAFSGVIARKVKYELNEKGELRVKNPLETEALYKFPDLTAQTVFLARAIQETIGKDLPEELLFLQCYDELKGEIQRIVDMPDKKVDKMILFLHQNKGKLALRKRKFFEELDDSEVSGMELAYQNTFTRARENSLNRRNVS